MIKNYLTYIREALHNFKIGDRVIHDTSRQNFTDSEAKLEVGVICDIDHDVALVLFDNNWTFLQENGYLYCGLYDGNLRLTTPTEIRVSEDDPYGEEGW